MPHRVWILWGPKEAVFRGEAEGVSTVAPQGSECPAREPVSLRWGISTVDNTRKEAA